jgi:transcriptional regulator with XRE-family HTH domain
MPKSRQPAPRESARTLLAENIVRLRRDRGWSQEELAARSELDRSFVAHVERQQRNISLDNIEKLADALAVSVSTLLRQHKVKPFDEQNDREI